MAGSRPARSLTSPAPASARWLGAFDTLARRVLRRVFGQAPLRFELGDGTDLTVAGGAPVARVVFANRLAVLRLLPDPEARMCEEYATGQVEVEGDLVAAIEAASRAFELRQAPSRRRFPPAGHSLRASRRNVHRHYDLGNDFFGPWLDEQLVYTCAYFARPEASLEEAQAAKLELVCRKLGLAPGERVVEAGCGWGALALHMARGHGVSVVAYNLSHEQIAHARERARREGLADRVEFVEADYRTIAGRFDAFVSVGMLEHVGPENYGILGAVMDRCLDPARGRGLLHFIGRDQPRPLSAWIRANIFPGAYPPTLAQVAEDVLQPYRFSILDVENLRLHYERTLRHWRTRYERSMGEVERRFGRRFARAWRLYLAGSEAAFRVGSLQLFQVGFARAGLNSIPWTRPALYAGLNGWSPSKS